MHIFNVLDLALKNEGEYVLGSVDLRTHACYLIYGVLNPDEKEKVIMPGKGHEEIVCLIKGEVLLFGGSENFSLKQGQAFHLQGEEKFFMENKGDVEAVYIIAGGHSEPHGHKKMNST